MLATVRARTTAELYSLSREDIFSIFRDMPEALSHMKDIALENFVVSNRLDAEPTQENEALNDFIESQVAAAVNSRQDHLAGHSKRSTRASYKSVPKVEEKKATTDIHVVASEPSAELETTVTSADNLDASLHDKNVDSNNEIKSDNSGSFSGDNDRAAGSDETTRRLGALEAKFDKLLNALSISHSSPKGYSQSFSIRQQAMKDEREITNIKRSFVHNKSGRRSGGKEFDIEKEMSKDTLAAMKERRVTRMNLSDPYAKDSGEN